jgi:uncharacterized protein
MDWTIILILSLAIGVVIGLTGAGGTILTLPVLVYVAGIAPLEATSYTLFIVGSTALLGSMQYVVKREIALKGLLVLAIPSSITVLLTRFFILPRIPDTWTVFGWEWNKEAALMTLFVLIMLLASSQMIVGKSIFTPKIKACCLAIRIAFFLSLGAAVGVMSGLVGAGGGFLLIPALVLLMKIPMRKAIGTSLVIIFLNSALGFTTDVHLYDYHDWMFLIPFTSFSIAGVLIGGRLTGLIPDTILKKGFGYMVLVMALIIAAKEYL